MGQLGRLDYGFSRNFGLAVALLLLTATPALAGNRQARERAARKACLSGDYAKGMDILSDLFVESQDPVYIFNQGRCLEQNQRYKDAIARFQEYLRTGETHKLKADDQAAAKKHIAACKGNLPSQPVPEQTSTLPETLTPPPASPTPSPVPAPVPEPSVPVVAQPESQPAPTSRGSRLRVAGIVAAAFGVAALGAGVGFNLLANSTIGDMESKLDGYSGAKNSSHDTYVTLAWVGYGVGAACVVTGAVLYGIGLKARSASSTNVAVVPTVGPGRAGAALVGAF